MVWDSSKGNGSGRHLRLIPGGLSENPSAGRGSHRKFRHLARILEPVMEEMVEEARKVPGWDSMKKVSMLCLAALVRDEVGSDPMPALREAAVAADAQADRALAAELMVQVADTFRMCGLDPWPVMDMAFRCAQEVPDGKEKDEVLAGIAYSYAILGDYPRAERIMNMLDDSVARKGLMAAIDRLVSSMQEEE